MLHCAGRGQGGNSCFKVVKTARKCNAECAKIHKKLLVLRSILILHLCYFLSGHGGTEEHSKFLHVCFSV